MTAGPPALLALEDGTVFRGRAFAATSEAFGEAFFNRRYLIRTAAAQAGIPCITTLPGALAALRGVEALRGTPRRAPLVAGAS